MEFLIGLSVGMHLGRVIAECLEKFGKAYGLLESKTVREIERIEALERDLSSLVDRATD
jgi:hypothetical protein